MDKPQSNLIFIDRINFINLQDAKFNLEDLRREITGDVKVVSSSSEVNKNGVTLPARSELLSPLTIAIIDKTNELLNKSFFDGYFFRLYDTGIYNLISEKDIKYVSHYVKDYLTKEQDNNLLDSANAIDGVSKTPVNKKYYELIPLLNGDVLVVLEEGFFNITTESKNSLTEFVLDCLRLQYKFSLDYRQLMKLYLKLHINENALNMVKLRFN